MANLENHAHIEASLDAAMKRVSPVDDYVSRADVRRLIGIGIRYALEIEPLPQEQGEQ